MALKIRQDLTTGPIPLHFRALAIPAAIGMLFNTLYNVVDVFYAGLLATSAQAGLALGFQIHFLGMSVGVGLGAAMGALIGNALGAGDRKRARRLSAQGISFGFIASILLVIASIWYAPALIKLVSATGDYQDAAIRYFQILVLSLPAFLVAYACNGVLQAHGDGRSMQRALVVAFVVNVGLNPLLMFGVPGLWGGIGFDGLALSTLISQMGVMIYLIRQVLRLDTMARVRPVNFLPRLPRFIDIAMQALPTGFAFLIMILAGVVVQYALKGFGEHAVAGFGIAIRLEQLVILPLQGLASALLPIAAQNFGANNPDRVREALFHCWKMGALLCLITGPILWIFGPMAIGAFTDDAEVIRVGLIYLRIGSVMLIVYMLHFSITAFLQAMKRPIWSLWISLYRQAFGVAFFIWVFVGWLGFGEIGVWFGTSTSAATGAVMALFVTAHVAREKIGGLRGA